MSLAPVDIRLGRNTARAINAQREQPGMTRRCRGAMSTSFVRGYLGPGRLSRNRPNVQKVSTGLLARPWEERP
jgi:hypothetical protein